MHTYKVEDFGSLPTGESVSKITIANEDITVSMINYGAIILSVIMKDKNGTPEEITLNFKTLDEYLSNAGYYYGATVGRYANRIANGRFSLEGVEYTLAVNNGKNSLHGGNIGWARKVWSFDKIETESTVGIKFSITSLDGDEGYPGTVTMSACYVLSDSNDLSIHFEGTTDKTTVMNLTNHTYWNLSGDYKTKIYEQLLEVKADTYLPVDDMIPTGEYRAVKDTPFDFTTPTACSQALMIDGGGRPGLDHCFCVPGEGLRVVGSLSDDMSGRKVEVMTTMPGIQVYMGNWIEGEFPHLQHNGVALECQFYPDAPNQLEFPSTVVHADEKFDERIVFRFILF